MHAYIGVHWSSLEYIGVCWCFNQQQRSEHVLILYHPFTFLTLIGPLISSKLSTSTTWPFCITSTSPASFLSHIICRTSSMVSLHPDASSVRSSSIDNARAISEGQIVLGQALVLNRRSAWRDIMDLLASSRGIVFCPVESRRIAPSRFSATDDSWVVSLRY